jgi:hypothetical protein
MNYSVLQGLTRDFLPAEEKLLDNKFGKMFGFSEYKYSENLPQTTIITMLGSKFKKVVLEKKMRTTDYDHKYGRISDGTKTGRYEYAVTAIDNLLLMEKELGLTGLKRNEKGMVVGFSAKSLLSLTKAVRKQKLFLPSIELGRKIAKEFGPQFGIKNFFVSDDSIEEGDILIQSVTSDNPSEERINIGDDKPYDDVGVLLLILLDAPSSSDRHFYE